jgi:hypothetical protein
LNPGVITAITTLIQIAGLTFQQFKTMFGKEFDPAILEQIRVGYERRISAREAEQRRIESETDQEGGGID